GALAEMINGTLKSEYQDLATTSARVTIVDHGPEVLGPFSKRAHEYAAKGLEDDGVRLRMETGGKEVCPGHAVLSDGTQIATRCVIGGGGIAAAPLAESCGLPQGHGGRLEVRRDLTVEGFPNVYALGDLANISDADGHPLPQLGSVALQSGRWAASHILAAPRGQAPPPLPSP